jgi:hypothetical protein
MIDISYGLINKNRQKCLLFNENQLTISNNVKKDSINGHEKEKISKIMLNLESFL